MGAWSPIHGNAEKHHCHVPSWVMCLAGACRRARPTPPRPLSSMRSLPPTTTLLIGKRWPSRRTRRPLYPATSYVLGRRSWRSLWPGLVRPFSRCTGPTVVVDAAEPHHPDRQPVAPKASPLHHQPSPSRHQPDTRSWPPPIKSSNRAPASNTISPARGRVACPPPRPGDLKPSPK